MVEELWTSATATGISDNVMHHCLGLSREVFVVSRGIFLASHRRTAGHHGRLLARSRIPTRSSGARVFVDYRCWYTLTQKGLFCLSSSSSFRQAVQTVRRVTLRTKHVQFVKHAIAPCGK